MLTYNDLLECGEYEEKRKAFLLRAINEHENSEKFKIGQIAGEFYRGNDPILEKVQKIIYDMQGIGHNDIFSPNHKIYSNFYFVFVTQMITYSLGNGVSFDNKAVREKLGTGFDHDVMKVLEYAANDGEAYAYISDGKIIPMSMGSDIKHPFFIPLFDEDSGRLRAGIRYWRVDENKPLRITLFEEDGVTEYKQPNGKSVEVLKPKRKYNQKIKTYPYADVSALPIARLCFINNQSYIKKRVNALTAYNALLSKMVNNSEESDLIYWVLKNCDAMDAIDDAEQVADLIKRHVLHLKDGIEADPHQLNAPYEGTQATLELLRKQLFYDFMAVDFERVSGGNITTSEIKQGYENMNLKADKVEMCITDFILEVLAIMGFDENEKFHFTRPKNINESEAIQTAVIAAPYMGDEETTKTICEIMGKIDEFEEIQARKAAERITDFDANEEENDAPPPDISSSSTEEIIEEAEEQKGTSLNGAQTQSLLSIIAQYTAGSLTENQAVNIISTAIGISKDKAREILQK